MKQILLMAEGQPDDVGHSGRVMRIMLKQKEQFQFKNAVVIADKLNSKTAATISSNDEIFISDSLVPYSGYGGSMVNNSIINCLFTELENLDVENKKIYLFRDNKSISWYLFQGRTFYSLFQKNELYVTNSVTQEWEKVNAGKLAEFEMNYDVPELEEVKFPVKKSVKKKK